MDSNGFVHLHVHTEFSLLDGACRIKPLIKACVDRGMEALAVTDHGVMYCVVDFYEECIKNKIKPIIGCEVYTAKRTRFDKEINIDSDYGHLILLAENNIGYHNLMKIVSCAYTEGYYYKPRIDLDLLTKYHEGIICSSACIGGDVPQLILHDDYEGAKKLALIYRSIFGENNYFLEIQSNGIEEQILVNQGLIRMSQETGIPLVATNDVHFIDRSDSRAQDILMCVQTGKRVTDQDRMKFSTDQIYFRSPEEMKKLFVNQKEAIENTVRIANRCNVTLEFGRPVLPNFEIPGGITPSEYLVKLTFEGAHKRYGDILTDEINQRLEYELSVINKMGYAEYYLIVWDFIKYAKENGIPVGPGRGSGAGSLVAYCLRITNIDSLKYNLAFERFLNPERISMPDFDVDFCDERRKEVIDYVTTKYGEDRVAQIATFGTMAAKGAIRDVGRVLNIPYTEVDAIAKMVPMIPGKTVTIDKALEINQDLREKYENDETIKDLIDTAKQLEGMPRNVGTHAAGVVLTKNPVTDYVPVHKMADSGVSTQFPMAVLEKLGLLKVDFLGLRTLSVISDSVELIKSNYNKIIDFDTMEMNDSAVFKTICDGKTSGIFQLESPGMTRFMTDLQPDNIEDIIAGIALYRPGPMDQIPKYIENKRNPDAVTYAHKLLEPILKVTYGCIVYQEQVMQIVRDLAGYTMGQSDLVRRAMSKKKAEVMEKERANFITGAEKNGVSKDIANSIFETMTVFAGYAFNKAHAACYAVVGYQTAWLKTYYPVEFMAAIMNSYSGANERVAQYIAECRILGITILPPDINSSYPKFIVDNGQIRFGLAAIKNVGSKAAESIIEERKNNGDYKDFGDFCERMSNCEVNKRCIESFIKSGAFDSMGVRRSQLLDIYELLLEDVASAKKKNIEGQMSLFDMGTTQSMPLIHFKDIKEFDNAKLLSMEKEMMGVYVSGHPLTPFENQLSSIRNLKSSDLIISEETDLGGEGLDTGFAEHVKDNMTVTIGGIITNVKKKITKNNSMMAFVSLEDMFGTFDLLIFPKTYEQFIGLLKEETLVVVKGRLSLREDEAPKILPDSIVEMNKYFNTATAPININFLCDKNKKDIAEAYIKYFNGQTNIVIQDKDTGEILINGNIKATAKILSKLQEIIK